MWVNKINFHDKTEKHHIHKIYILRPNWFVSRTSLSKCLAFSRDIICLRLPLIIRDGGRPIAVAGVKRRRTAVVGAASMRGPRGAQIPISPDTQYQVFTRLIMTHKTQTRLPFPGRRESDSNDLLSRSSTRSLRDEPRDTSRRPPSQSFARRGKGRPAQLLLSLCSSLSI